MQERREQLQMMMQWHDEVMALENEEIHYIEKALLDDGVALNEKGRRTLRKNIKQFGFDHVLKAAKIAKEQYDSNEERIKKLGGIAYNKVFVEKEW